MRRLLPHALPVGVSFQIINVGAQDDEKQSDENHEENESHEVFLPPSNDHLWENYVLEVARSHNEQPTVGNEEKLNFNI